MVRNPKLADPSYEMCQGNGTAWYMAEWAQAGAASPEPERGTRPAVENVTFTGVEAVARRVDGGGGGGGDGGDGNGGGDLAGRPFDLGAPSTDWWNTTQPVPDGTEAGSIEDDGPAVFVAQPRDDTSFVIYTPDGKNSKPSPQEE